MDVFVSVLGCSYQKTFVKMLKITTEYQSLTGGLFINIYLIKAKSCCRWLLKGFLLWNVAVMFYIDFIFKSDCCAELLYVAKCSDCFLTSLLLYIKRIHSCKETWCLTLSPLGHSTGTCCNWLQNSKINKLCKYAKFIHLQVSLFF